MTIDRRSFLYAGGLTAAAAPLASAAHAATGQGGRSVTEFGVELNVDLDQTEALQKALMELSAAGQIALLPAGRISVGKLSLPSICTIAGVQGATFLKARQISAQRGLLSISGVSLSQLPGGGDTLLSNPDGELVLRDCAFDGTGKRAIGLGERCVARLHSVQFSGWEGSALFSESVRLVVESCSFHFCGAGIEAAPSARTSVVNCHFEMCGIGAAISGTGLVNGNMVLGAKTFGLKLGSSKGDGHILCQSNLISDCRIGIGVSASGDDIMCSLNMIAGAKEAAIRAFDGEKLVGPDLARQSAEAYLNLMVAGNVVR